MVNEKRMIYKEDLLETILGHFGIDLAYLGSDLQFCQEAIENAPTVGAVEVVHGRWIEVRGRYTCSVCKGKALLHFGAIGACLSNYCPNCGAKMDGDGNG